MSYASSAGSLSSKKSSLKGTLSDIDSINFDSWQGSAHDKLTSDKKDLKSGFETQCNQIDSLVDALKLIDEYDNLEDTINRLVSSRNNLDKDASNYQSSYNYYSEKITSSQNDRANKATSIKSLLSSIKTKYASTLSVKSFDNYSDRAGELIGLDKVKSSIAYGLDMKNTVSSFANVDASSRPDFSNSAAWTSGNPYSGPYTGQCTWFAWGRFYEIYGYDPGFRGNGNQCVGQLLNAHPDKFKLSSTPVPGSVFSAGYYNYSRNHVGMVIDVQGDMITIQDGNMNGRSDSFAVAQNDWRTYTISLSEFKAKYGGDVAFANPI